MQNIIKKFFSIEPLQTLKVFFIGFYFTKGDPKKCTPPGTPKKERGGGSEMMSHTKDNRKHKSPMTARELLFSSFKDSFRRYKNYF